MKTPRHAFAAAAIAMVSAVAVVHAQTPDAVEGTATLRGSGVCSVIGNFKSVRCSKTNVLTKAMLDSSPRLHLIDGQGPADYQCANCSPPASWTEDNGFFLVPMVAGKHKLSLSYHKNMPPRPDGTAVAVGPVEEVEIEVEARHSYEIHSVEGNKGWIVYDVTDKSHQTATVIVGQLRITLSFKS